MVKRIAKQHGRKGILNNKQIRCNHFGKPKSEDEARDLKAGHLDGNCSPQITMKPNVIDRHYNGKQFQYKPHWDHPVTILRANCVHGGLCHPPASNLIAVTKSSGA